MSKCGAGCARRFVPFVCRASLGWSAAIVLACFPANARRQQTPQTATHSQSSAQSSQNSTQSQNSAQPQTSARQQGSPPTDASREELANFDQFLANHPILERELESNPSLLNDSNYVQSEPDLQIFLTHHPYVKTELGRDPGYLQRHRDASTATRTGLSNGKGSLNSADTEKMEQFLNSHQGVSEKLKENPALINDSTFLTHNPELQSFLNENPSIWEEVARDPRYLTQHEPPQAGAPEHRDSAKPNPPATNYVASDPAPSHRPSASTDRVGVAGTSSSTSRTSPPSYSNPSSSAGSISTRSNPAVNPEDVARMNQFLEDHRDIAKQLEKDPLLVTDHKYLDKHKDLRRFFNENVRLREVFADNPQYFTARNSHLRSAGSFEGAPGAELTDRDLAEMEKFLQKHKDIAKQLRTNSWMGKEPQYLQHHKDLRRFFDEHPHVQEEFDENPGAFMRQQAEFERRANVELVNR